MIKPRKLRRTGKTVYDVRLRDPQGKVYNRTFPNRKAAERFEAAERTDRARGTWIDPRFANMTVAELGERWLAANPAKRSGTRARDSSIIRVKINPTLGSRPIGSVPQPDVQGLVSAWAKTAAPRTVRRQYGVLRAIFAYAVAAEFLVRSPCRDINLPEVVPLRRAMPTPDQLAALADELEHRGANAGAAMLWTAVLTGLRWGEVAGLRVGSLDLLRGELRVVEQRTRDLEGDGVTAEPKSAAGVRTLSIPPELVDLLAGHMAAGGLTAAEQGALVFTGERGGPLNYSHWRGRVWEPACQRAGLAGLTFHDLRRANATGMVAEGVDLKTAQTRFGHSDPRLTIGLYAQAVSEADRQAAAGLAARFLPRDGRAMVRDRAGRRLSPQGS
jgi:integrase